MIRLLDRQVKSVPANIAPVQFGSASIVAHTVTMGESKLENRTVTNSEEAKQPLVSMNRLEQTEPTLLGHDSDITNLKNMEFLLLSFQDNRIKRLDAIESATVESNRSKI